MSIPVSRDLIKFIVRVCIATQVFVLVPAYASESADPAEECVWRADDAGLTRLPGQQATSAPRVPLEGITALAVDGKCAAYAVAKGRLVKLDHAGTVIYERDIDELGIQLADVAHISVNPYDGTIWLADANTLAHLSAVGDLLSADKGRGLIRALALSQSRSLWVLGNKELWKVAGGEELVDSARLIASHEVPRLLVEDSLAQLAWLAGEKQLTRINLAQPSASDRSIVLPARAKALTLNALNGDVWVIAGSSVTIVQRDGLVKQTIDLKALGLLDASHLAFDPGSNTVWIAGSEEVLQLDAVGTVLDRTSTAGRSVALAAPMLELAHAIVLQRPTSGSVSNVPRPVIGYQVELLCNQRPCSSAVAELVDASLVVALNGKIIGPFVRDPVTDEVQHVLADSLPEGVNILTAFAKDGFGNASPLVEDRFTLDTIPPAFLSLLPASGSVLVDEAAVIEGVVDDPGATVVLGGSAAPVRTQSFDSSLGFSIAVSLVPGNNTFSVNAIDQAGNRATREIVLAFTPPLPPAPVASQISVGKISGGMVVVTGNGGSVAPLLQVAIGNARSGQTVIVLADSNGAFSAAIGASAGDAITVSAHNKWGSSAPVSISIPAANPKPVDPNTVEGIVPPDPATLAPPLSPVVPTSLGASTAFLYTGPNAIQVGVAPGTIEQRRVAVVRGRVLDQDGTPLPAVRVRVAGQPELGHTFSRADGHYDLAVNGGGDLTLVYDKSGLLPAQRQVRAPWQDYVQAPEVAMVVLDDKATVVDLATSQSMQVAQGSVVTDANGTRQVAVLFPAGLTAKIVKPDGVEVSLPSITFRATEYTVGEKGLARMPAPLPSSAGYTYAVELSVDEAITAGARTVNFSQAVPVLVDNFLEFEVGSVIPFGYYDHAKSVWVPVRNGRIIKVLSISNGMADLDVHGNGQVADAAMLASMQISQEELRHIAQLYPVGKTLTRFTVTHFSPWDGNPAVGPPPGAIEPSGCDSSGNCAQFDQEREDAPTKECGSIIECENQVLGERIPLAGVPFGLNYRSNRAIGHSATRRLRVPLSAASLPSSLTRIEATIDIAGRRIVRTFEPRPDQTLEYEWDGKDAYGRQTVGRALAVVTIAYIYPATYYWPRLGEVASNGFNTSSGVVMNSWASRSEVRVERKVQGFLTAGLGGEAGSVGGWTFDNHHFIDPEGDVLMLGDGSSHQGKSVNVIGVGVVSQPSALIVDAEGTIISPSDGGRKFKADGTTTLLGKYYMGFRTLAGDGKGNLYYYSSSFARVTIIRISPDGVHTPIAGDGLDIPPALRKPLRPVEMAVDRDGSIYFSEKTVIENGYYVEKCRVRKLTPDGSISLVAGNGTCYGNQSGDGGPAGDATLVNPTSLAIDSLGNLYIADGQAVRKVTPDGLIETVAGMKESDAAGCVAETASPDGIAATEFCLGYVRSIAVDKEDNLVIASALYMNSLSHWRSAVVRVKGDGTVATIAASSGADCDRNDTLLQQVGPATAICSDQTFSAVTVNADNEVLAAHGNKLVYVGAKQMRCLNGQGNVALSCEGAVAGADETFIPSTDASQSYVFNKEGLHIRTVNARTRAVIFTFAYDAGRRLVSVTDGNGKVTAIERNADGDPTAVIGPYGQRSEISVDEEGRLTSVGNPLGETYRMEYDMAGLLRRFESPRKLSATFSYDAQGRLTFDANAAGGFWQLDRSADGDKVNQVITRTALGRTKVYRSEYGQDGTRLRTAIDSAGFATVTALKGASATTTAPDGTVTTSVLGPDPRFGMQAAFNTSTSIKLPSGLTYAASAKRTAVLNAPNDPFSLMSEVQEVNLNGNVFRTDYDAMKRQYTLTSPLNRKSVLTIDALGRPLVLKNGSLHDVRYQYDEQGRLVAVSQGDGAAARNSTIVYNPQGLIESQTNAANQTTRFTYDAAGRVQTKTLPNERVITYRYDENGNIVAILPPGRTPHQFDYNAADLVSAYTPPSVQGALRDSLEYNLDKQIIRLNRPDGNAISFDYDEGGRILDISSATAPTKFAYQETTGLLASVATGEIGLNYTYDGSLPRKISLAGPVRGVLDADYDQFFRMKSLGVNGAAVRFDYDQDGLLIQAGDLVMTRNSENGLLVGTVLGTSNTSVAYDGFGEVSAISVKQGSTELFSETYVRDTLGRVKQKTTVQQGGSTVVSYEYDESGRLVGVTRNGAPVGSFAYDANGNRTSAHGYSASYDAQDRLVEFGGARYGYTANGDLAWTEVNNRTSRYSYDGLGTLTQAVLADGRQIDYLIDGMQRRVGKKVDGVLQQGFLYQDQIKPVAELDGNNNIVARFVYSERPNVPEYMIKNNVTYRLVLDRLGSVRMVVNVATGEIAQQLEYDAWGNVEHDSNPGFQPFGYAGGLYDRDTGLVRFGARDYDPFTARWTSKDPIRFAGGDTNLYAYVHGDPVSYNDPLGLWSVTFGGYVGAGFEITFGNDNGNGFMTARVGFGIGGGFSIDPNGGIPGPDIANRCEGGVVAAVSGAVDFNAGPVSAGVEKGVGRNYSSGESSTYGDKGISFSDSFRGINATGSVGASVTIYSGR